MKAIKRHFEDMEKYQRIIQESKNPYIINDYSKAIRRLERELKIYCELRGFNYNKILKNYKKSVNRELVR